MESRARPPTPRPPPGAGLPVLLAACLLLTACRAPVTREVDVRLTTRPDPARVGPARLELTLGGPAGSVRSVSVEGNMTHAGMAPVRAQAAPAGPGRYVVDAFTFSMAGDWVVTVTAHTGDGQTLSTDVPLEVGP